MERVDDLADHSWVVARQGGRDPQSFAGQPVSFPDGPRSVERIAQGVHCGEQYQRIAGPPGEFHGLAGPAQVGFHDYRVWLPPAGAQARAGPW